MGIIFCARAVALLAIVAGVAPAAADPKGALDGVAGGVLSGWALDPARPEARGAVAIYADGPEGVGTLAATIPTDSPRDDVNGVYHAAGRHGFRWPIPPAQKDKPHLWWVYARIG